MKIKYSNRVISIFNVVIFVAFSFFGMYLLHPNNLEVEFSMYGIFGELEESIIIGNILAAIFLIVGIVNLIINISNKKYIIWSSIPIIFFIEILLNNLELEIISDIFYQLWCIIPGIAFIVALIIEIRKDKIKKNIILYILAIIMSIAMFFVEGIKDYASYVWFTIASIMMFIYSKETIEESKAKKIIMTIFLAILIIFSIFYVIKTINMAIKLYETDRETVQFIEQIKTGLNSETFSEDTTLLLVNRDNKWGYINETGIEVIPCKYDAISYLLGHKFLVAKNADVYDIISRNGIILATNIGAPVPLMKGEAFDYFLENLENNYNSFLVNAQLMLSAYIEDSEFVQNYYYQEFYIEPTYSSYNENSNTVYEYDMQNGSKLYIEEFKNNEDEERYNIQVERNNQIMETIENVEIPFSSELGEEGRIVTYISGDIPFVNLDKQIQGYYSINEGMAKFLEGKYQILDKKNDLIIVRDYNNPNNTRDYIMNSNTGEIVYIAKNISAYEDGYVTQKYNGDIVYVDNNFNEIIKGFDVIYLLEKVNVLICGNNINSNEYTLYDTQNEYLLSEGTELYNREYSLYDIQGNKLTDYTYQIMFSELENQKYYGKSYLFDNSYYNYYVNEYN